LPERIDIKIKKINLGAQTSADQNPKKDKVRLIKKLIKRPVIKKNKKGKKKERSTFGIDREKKENKIKISKKEKKRFNILSARSRKK